ncbi:MAG: hypothetical protein IID40_01035, partial [Planctomycetes bacterium]|nr:hypothetical protein [Planctomycetota bacterium]
VLVVAALSEAAQVFSTMHVADVTELLLAAAAAVFALAAFGWVWPTAAERTGQATLAPAVIELGRRRRNTGVVPRSRPRLDDRPLTD